MELHKQLLLKKGYLLIEISKLMLIMRVVVPNFTIEGHAR